MHEVRLSDFVWMRLCAVVVGGDDAAMPPPRDGTQDSGRSRRLITLMFHLGKITKIISYSRVCVFPSHNCYFVLVTLRKVVLASPVYIFHL